MLLLGATLISDHDMLLLKTMALPRAQPERLTTCGYLEVWHKQTTDKFLSGKQRRNEWIYLCGGAKSECFW
jgi:hypothetical protein